MVISPDTKPYLTEPGAATLESWEVWTMWITGDGMHPLFVYTAEAVDASAVGRYFASPRPETRMGAATARRQSPITVKTKDRPSSIPRQLVDAALCRFRIAFHRAQHAHFRK
jgi:hypothetical protein